MHTNNINNRQAIPSFGKFIKIKGHTKKILEYRDDLKQKDYDFLSVVKEKDNGKSILYLFSGRHFDKFLDLMRDADIYFRDLRTNPEKFLNEKPQKLTLEQAQKLKNIFKEKI